MAFDTKFVLRSGLERGDDGLELAQLGGLQDGLIVIEVNRARGENGTVSSVPIDDFRAVL